MNKRYDKKVCGVVLGMLAMVLSSMCVVASEDDSGETYYLHDSFYNTGKDNGFSGQNEITKKDVHYGWDLGAFYASGYTRVDTDSDETPIFLKNVGDQVALKFDLQQDIDVLNKDERLTIADDDKGYDQNFETDITDFGRGTLIVQKTDFQNHLEEPILYTDYLSGKTAGANIDVLLCEEGDYEIALDYSVKYDPRNIAGKISLFPEVYDYRISFKFKVRNGNCMVYPFDVKTNSELTNTSITENGFKLDLAKSRYLKIDIKKENLQEGATGLTEDVRFNKPASDGEEFTDEGIYTISVKNEYTQQETIKKIYVGTDDILKAYMITGLTIEQIQTELSQGATINDDGTLNQPPEHTIEEVESTVEITESLEDNEEPIVNQADNATVVPENIENKRLGNGLQYILLGVGVVLTIVIAGIIKKNISKENDMVEEHDVVENDTSGDEAEENKE